METVVLIVVAGITAGLWLNLIMWLPMLALGAMRDTEAAFTIVSLLSMFVAAAPSSHSGCSCSACRGTQPPSPAC
jgi:hypothetical protein